MTIPAVSRVYRPDIDGLRAVAVLAVLLFHTAVPGFSGGFVGVDVFFVISGFLITRNIVARQEAGSFTFADFYHRRVRRILPALFVTIALTLAVSPFFIPYNELKGVFDGAASATASVSNIYFWLQSNYFSPDARFQPLLHTWSLGVEEQFYLVWPAFLLVLLRFNRFALLLGALIIVLAAAIIASEWAIPRYPAAAFYLLPFRMGELALGALCVWAPHIRFKRGVVLELINIVALTAILTAVFLFTDETPFPGVRSLLPCLGAAAIIVFGASRWIGGFLTWKPVIWLGLISYSLYLVHWPLISFHFSAFLRDPTLGEAALICAASIALAAASYRFVETPVRRGIKRTGALKAGPVFGVVAVLSGALLAVSLYGAPALRQAEQPPMEIQALETAFQEQADAKRDFFDHFCNVTMEAMRQDTPPDLSKCTVLDPARRNVLVIGSSYATESVKLLERAYPEVNFMELTAPGCIPVRGDSRSEINCNHIADYLDQFLPGNTDIDAVVVGQAWRNANSRRLRLLLEELKADGRPIVVLGLRGRLKARLFPIVRQLENVNANTTLDLSYRDPLHDKIEKRVRTHARNNGARYIPLEDFIWEGDALPVFVAPGKFIFIDEGHLTLEGLDMVAGRLRAAYPDFDDFAGLDGGG